jgi:diguanylate cyclase (GGDEF)-like protein
MAGGPHRRPVNRYLAALVGVWGLLQIVSLGSIAHLELERVRRQVDEAHDDIARHIGERTSVYEAALQGFASFLAAVPDSSYTEARRFAKLVREHYPDIYMLEIARRLTHAERDGLEQSMRAAGYRDFALHTFGYDTDRMPHPSPPKDVYYPIVFIEPELPAALGVLGLDLGETSSLLTDALQRSFRQRGHVASRPFQLMEGNRGYVLYRPVTALRDADHFELTPTEETYALLVADADALVPGWLGQHPGMAMHLSYTGVRKPADDMLVYRHNLRLREAPLEQLLPAFSRSTPIPSASQPFTLTTRYQVGWSDLNLALLAVYLVSAVLTFILAHRYAAFLMGRRLRDEAQQEQLFERANFDALTRLPNRSLIRDRIGQALAHVRRRRSHLGLLYLDLDDFKSINDRLGHAAGDALLQRVSDRLTQALRAGDTVARLHGDEFVVLLPDIESPATARQVADKLQSLFAAPCLVAGQPVPLGVSIGVAIGPEDGDSTDALLETADRKMYEAKHAHRLHLVADH